MSFLAKLSSALGAPLTLFVSGYTDEEHKHTVTKQLEKILIDVLKACVKEQRPLDQGGR